MNNFPKQHYIVGKKISKIYTTIQELEKQIIALEKNERKNNAQKLSNKI